MPNRRGLPAIFGVAPDPVDHPATISRITRLLTPSVEIPFEGKSYPVVFSHEVLLEIEAVGKLSLLDGTIGLTYPSATVLRAALFVVLRRAGASCSLEHAGRLLGGIDRYGIQRLLIAAWFAAMPAPEPEAPTTKNTVHRSWMDIWSDNKENLDITDDEWLSYTPRMVQALSKQHLEVVRQKELMLARIAAAVANFGGNAPKQPINEDLFMLHPWPKKSQAITGEYIAQVIGMFKRDAKEDVS